MATFLPAAGAQYLLTSVGPPCSIDRTNPFKCLLSVATALGIALIAASCSSKSGDSIVGKWARGNDLVFTFTKDGSMIRQEGAGSETMGYSVSGTTLYLKPKDMPTSLVYTISFPAPDELVLTPQPAAGAAISQSDNEPIRFSRVSD